MTTDTSTGADLLGDPGQVSHVLCVVKARVVGVVHLFGGVGVVRALAENDFTACVVLKATTRLCGALNTDGGADLAVFALACGLSFERLAAVNVRLLEAFTGRHAEVLFWIGVKAGVAEAKGALCEPTAGFCRRACRGIVTLAEDAVAEAFVIFHSAFAQQGLITTSLVER